MPQPSFGLLWAADPEPIRLRHLCRPLNCFRPRPSLGGVREEREELDYHSQEISGLRLKGRPVPFATLPENLESFHAEPDGVRSHAETVF